MICLAITIRLQYIKSIKAFIYMFKWKLFILKKWKTNSNPELKWSSDLQ